ncbi:MAG: peptidoglycan DD-metalloendopeptidase family protein [Emergencia sp.]
MNKKKLVFQTAVCAMILSTVFFADKSGNQTVLSWCDKARTMVMHQVTREEAAAFGSRIVSGLSDAPAKVVSAVMEAGSASRYGVPIDEKAEGGVKQVHAAAGGVVEASGKSEELGLYIRLRHDGAVSVYGNLSDIGVVESERVQRGEIIGSYDTSSEKDFYYDLQENL